MRNHKTDVIIILGQTEAVDNSGAGQDDFLARERAALGEDADQFATPQDHAGDGNDDLLGGGDIDTPTADVGGFESSFPSMETQTQNEVRTRWVTPPLDVLVWIVLTRRTNPYSALLPVAPSQALDPHSLAPDIPTPKSLKKKLSPSGKFDQPLTRDGAYYFAARFTPRFYEININ